MHTHEWTLVNAALRRYRCACGVYAHAPAYIARSRRRRVVPLLCQKQIDARGTHCSKEAVYVTGDRQQSRCADHAPVSIPVSARTAEILGGAADEVINRMLDDEFATN